MGRTILYILIGVSVIGALAVLMLITPITEAVDAPGIMPEALSEASDDVTLTTEIEPALSDEPVEPIAADDPTEAPTDEGAEPAITEPAVAEADYAIDGWVVDGEYAHEMTIAGIEVYWANDAQQLRIGLVSPGTGYVSIGFDPDRQMEGANIIIAAVHEGQLTIRDDYGHEPLAHIEDTIRGGQDDIIASAGNQWPDETVIEFIIPLDSGDSMDKPLLAGHAYTVLVAYHSMLDDFSNRHTRRGSGEMQLDLPE
ncbi:hypothetical protein KAH43_00765 [Candidatus Bipolaricaulota bacterium]|nr:hypothetical protein [Candidatus Bipolaricaulota bacterium]